METGEIGNKAYAASILAGCRARLSGDEFLKQSMVLFLASMGGCVCSYLYQIYVARALGPEGYAVFGSLFAIFYLISVFSGTVQAGAARFVSRFCANGEEESVGPFFRDLVKRSALLGGAGFLLFTFVSPWVAGFLKLNSAIEVVILGTVILFAFLNPAASGVLQGIQRFYMLGFVSFSNLGLKFIFAIILVSLGYGVSGALGALALSMLAAFLIAFFSLRPYLSKKKADLRFDFQELYVYSLPTILVMLCLAVPSNLDVILAKHFFDGHEAGLYTAASVVGKMVLFLPGAIATVMFPKASQMKTLGESTWKILNRSLLLTGILSGAAAAVFVLFPGIMAIIFGEVYREAGEVQAIYAVTMALFALTWVVAQYCLATSRLRYVYLLIAFTAAEMVLVSMFHATIVQMAQLLAAANLILFLASYAYVFSRRAVC